MELLSKDEIIQIALRLEMEHLLNYCLTSRRFNKFVCENDKYWWRRLNQDYPGKTK